MNSEHKAKITITLIAIFVAGAIAGGFSVSAFSGRGGPPSLGNLTDRQMKRMARDLELTQDQIARIEPIVEEVSEAIRSVRRESMAGLVRLHKDMTKRIMAELTPEQAEVFKAHQEERRHRAESMLKHRRMDGEGMGPGRPGGERGPGYGPPPNRPGPPDGRPNQPPPPSGRSRP